MRDPTSFSPAQRQLQECQGALLCLSLPFPSVYALYTTLATLPTPRHPPFRTPSPPTPSTKSAHRHQPVISQAIRHPLTIHPLRHSYLSWSVCCHRCIFFAVFYYIRFLFVRLLLSPSIGLLCICVMDIALALENSLSSGLSTAYRTLDLHLMPRCVYIITGRLYRFTRTYCVPVWCVIWHPCCAANNTVVIEHLPRARVLMRLLAAWRRMDSRLKPYGTGWCETRMCADLESASGGDYL